MYTCRSNACFNRDIDVSVFRRDIIVCHAIVDVFNAPCILFGFYAHNMHSLTRIIAVVSWPNLIILYAERRSEREMEI